MDFRKIFNDRVRPEDFDKYRYRYNNALFADVIAFSHLDATKKALEIGPGTGQATTPILESGCSYLAIELGENFTAYMKQRFASYPNFQIIHGDFETYPFDSKTFDLVYSAATIQWIPEDLAFPKIYQMLKPGGTLAMFKSHDDYKTPNPALYEEIQQVYAKFFKPEIPYTRKFDYAHATAYGFTDFECREYMEKIEFTADEYLSYIHIHCDHLTLTEPHRSRFSAGIRDVISRYGGSISVHKQTILYLVKKT